MHRHADPGLQKTYRPSAGTLASVLLQLGSYQCVWWVVIRRYNTSGSWPYSHNGESVAGAATLRSQCVLEMENETEVEKLEVQHPIMMSLAKPVHTQSDLTLFSYSAFFSWSDWIPHGVVVYW